METPVCWMPECTNEARVAVRIRGVEGLVGICAYCMNKAFEEQGVPAVPLVVNGLGIKLKEGPTGTVAPLDSEPKA